MSIQMKRIYRYEGDLRMTAVVPVDAEPVGLGWRQNRDERVVKIFWKKQTMMVERGGSSDQYEVSFPKEWYDEQGLDWQVAPMESQLDGLRLQTWRRPGEAMAEAWESAMNDAFEAFNKHDHDMVRIVCEHPVYNATFSILPDPLDVEYDGVTLRDLLMMRECMNQEKAINGMVPWRNCDPWTWTPAQREAVSAHWSAQLKLKQSAAREAERQQVKVDHE